MLTTTLTKLFTRDLGRLRTEIESYQKEENLWLTDQQISDSAGNLCLHLIGNLNTYFGAILGNTGYIRHRDLEFSQKNIPRANLTAAIDEVSNIVSQTLQQLSADDLKKDYPALVFEEKTSTAFFLIHLTAHLSYHLGQINYHRRLLDI